jgi:hypothetical protein
VSSSPSSAPPAAPRPGVDRALVLLTLLAFAVRAVYLLLEPRCSLTGDE